MGVKEALLLLFCSVVVAAANPAVGVEWHWNPRHLTVTPKKQIANPAVGVEWHWKHRHVTVTPNRQPLPSEVLLDCFVPRVSTTGTKIVDGCGLSTASQQRIVGGSEVTPHSYPWQVALFIDEQYFCGGALISDEWVLTAAHCTVNAFKVEVVAGAHDITASESSQVTRVATEIVNHEHYFDVLNRNDVALLRVAALPRTSAISPVCLPSLSNACLDPTTMVTLSGWGRDSDANPGISNTLNDVTVPVISNSECSATYGSIITDNIICIDSTGGKGTCNGDSGGPMNYVSGGKTYTRGITSFGSSQGCEVGLPDAFTRVLGYLDWISEKTGIAIDP